MWRLALHCPYILSTNPPCPWATYTGGSCLRFNLSGHIRHDWAANYLAATQRVLQPQCRCISFHTWLVRIASSFIVKCPQFYELIYAAQQATRLCPLIPRFTTRMTCSTCSQLISTGKATVQAQTRLLPLHLWSSVGLCRRFYKRFYKKNM